LNNPSFRCRNDRQPLDFKRNRISKPFHPGNDTRQNSSKLVKTIVKTRHFPENATHSHADRRRIG